MLSDYRDDLWYPVFTEVLLKTLQSAFLAASVADFIACSIEALSPKINLNKSDRIIVLENLWKVFQVRWSPFTASFVRYFFFNFVFHSSHIERSANIVIPNSSTIEISMGISFIELQTSDRCRHGPNVWAIGMHCNVWQSTNKIRWNGSIAAVLTVRVLCKQMRWKFPSLRQI